MIICLDSNIQDRLRNNEGNTVVYIPPLTFKENGVYFENYGKLSDYKCVPHIFNDSVIPGEFVAFPSDLRHRSLPLKTDGSYKFILKLDFWVRARFKIYITLDGFTGSNQLCNCKMCDPYSEITSIL